MIHLMSETEIVACVTAMHCPEAVNLPRVWEVWNDGEVTMTKGGGVYGQRTRFTEYHGDAGLALPGDSLPVKGGKHSRIVVRDEAEALKARSLIFGEG